MEVSLPSGSDSLLVRGLTFGGLYVLSHIPGPGLELSRTHWLCHPLSNAEQPGICTDWVGTLASVSYCSPGPSTVLHALLDCQEPLTKCSAGGPAGRSGASRDLHLQVTGNDVSFPTPLCSQLSPPSPQCWSSAWPWVVHSFLSLLHNLGAKRA